METCFKHSHVFPVRTAAALLLFFLLLFPFGAAASGEDELVSLARSGSRVLIADFGLGFCWQCKTQSETLEKIKSAYRGKVIVRMVNVNKEKTLTELYGVEMIPHLVFFDAAGKVAFRKTGVMSYEDIAGQLSRMGVKR